MQSKAFLNSCDMAPRTISIGPQKVPNQPNEDIEINFTLSGLPNPYKKLCNNSVPASNFRGQLGAVGHAFHVDPDM